MTGCVRGIPPHSLAGLRWLPVFHALSLLFLTAPPHICLMCTMTPTLPSWGGWGEQDALVNTEGPQVIRGLSPEEFLDHYHVCPQALTRPGYSPLFVWFSLEQDVCSGKPSLGAGLLPLGLSTSPTPVEEWLFGSWVILGPLWIKRAEFLGAPQWETFGVCTLSYPSCPWSNNIPHRWRQTYHLSSVIACELQAVWGCYLWEIALLHPPASHTTEYDGCGLLFYAILLDSFHCWV